MTRLLPDWSPESCCCGAWQLSGAHLESGRVCVQCTFIRGSAARTLRAIFGVRVQNLRLVPACAAARFPSEREGGQACRMVVCNRGSFSLIETIPIILVFAAQVLLSPEGCWSYLWKLFELCDISDRVWSLWSGVSSQCQLPVGPLHRSCW